MVLRRSVSRLAQAAAQDGRLSRPAHTLTRCRAASSQASTDSEAVGDVEPLSSLMMGRPTDDIVETFDPVGQARKSGKKLPPSRYQYRSPKYYRGPLHPHQPPPASDPASREFVPGPFTSPRLEQTYHATIAPDLMTLLYSHVIPGQTPAPTGQRLRSWDDSSPYHKNRPLRRPRGRGTLPLLKRPVTPYRLPRVERVTVHTMVKGAATDSAYLHTAGMVLQAITSVRATAIRLKKPIASFGVRAKKYAAVKCDLRGEDMYHFLSRCVDIVLPRIKDFQGIKGSSGDNSGNLTFGLEPDGVRLFPEIEVNYDMYPAHMIPGLHITIHTTATRDREARLLIGAFGFPFDGEFVD